MTQIILNKTNCSMILYDLHSTSHDLIEMLKLGRCPQPLFSQPPNILELGNIIYASDDYEIRQLMMTNKQRAVLDRLMEGKSIKTIAKELNLSPSGVNFRLHEMRDKFQVQTNAQLVHKYNKLMEVSTE